MKAGIDKTTYLDSRFDLSFLTVNDITNELIALGRGALLYKIDTRQAFCYVKIDPADYNLLGLQSDDVYLDMCLPFGMCHRGLIFQRLGDAVRHVMCCKGFKVVDYIGVASSNAVSASFDYLRQPMTHLGVSISEKKMVAPSMHVICLGVLIDIQNITVSIPSDKLDQILKNIKNLSTKYQQQRNRGGYFKISGEKMLHNKGIHFNKIKIKTYLPIHTQKD